MTSHDKTSQITRNSTIYSEACSCQQQGKHHQSSALLVLCERPENSFLIQSTVMRKCIMTSSGLPASYSFIRSRCGLQLARICVCLCVCVCVCVCLCVCVWVVVGVGVVGVGVGVVVVVVVGRGWEHSNWYTVCFLKHAQYLSVQF